jgi:hypothetical protein
VKAHLKNLNHEIKLGFHRKAREKVFDLPRQPQYTSNQQKGDAPADYFNGCLVQGTIHMSLRRHKRVEAIAALLLFSVAQIGVQVSFAQPTAGATPIPPQQFIARLTTRNNQPITVNGNGSASGSSILTGATIETGPDQSATVNLGPLGTLDIAPNTKLVLTYDEQGNVKVLLLQGCAVLTAKKKTKGEVATQQGPAGTTDPKKGGILDICFPPGASSPIVNQGAAAAAGAGAGTGGSAGAAAAGAGGIFGLGIPATIAIIAGGVAAGLSPIIFQNNPSNAV